MINLASIGLPYGDGVALKVNHISLDELDLDKGMGRETFYPILKRIF